MENVKINKRGNFVFNLVLVFGLLFLTVFIFFKFSNLEKSTSTSYIGEESINMINYYLEGETKSFFIEQSAKYSQTKTFQEFYLKGGYLKNECGVSNGYTLWIKSSKQCFLNKKNSLEEFTKLYNLSINSYDNLDAPNNYIVSFIGSNLLITGNEVTLKNNHITYYFKPKIVFKSKYNLDQAYEISESIKTNLDKCKQNIDCWKTIDNFDIKESNNVLYFDLNLGDNLDYFEKKNITFKFALDFNNPIFT